MNDIMKDVASVAMAIIGVAIIAVLVGPQSQTSTVIKASTSGFADVLGVAMGASAGQGASHGYSN